jgi:hypothetical protein
MGEAEFPPPPPCPECGGVPVPLPVLGDSAWREVHIEPCAGNLTAVCVKDGCDQRADPEYEYCPDCWFALPATQRPYPV